MLRIGFLNDRDLIENLRLEREVAHRFLDEAIVDLIDDLKVTGQKRAHHRDAPLLQRLGHQGVVGVAKAGNGDLPRLLPGKTLDVDKQAHQLGNRKARVGVVHLDRRKLVERVPIVAAVPFEAPDDVVQRAGDEEVLLLQPELLPHVQRIVGVKNLAEVFSGDLGAHRFGVVAFVELGEVELVDTFR